MIPDNNSTLTQSEFTSAGESETVGKEQLSFAPGYGKWTVPHVITFAGLVNQAIRAYHWAFDEALRHSHENALAMRRDPVIRAALRARKIPVVQLAWKLEYDESNINSEKEQRLLSRYASICEKAIRATPELYKMFYSLMDAIWYGKSAVQVQYQWKIIEGRNVLTIKNWFPINGDKIRYKWDGTVGITVYQSKEIESVPSDRYLVHFLSPREREQFIIHNYEYDDPDFLDITMAGSRYGVGIRNEIYWFWFLKSIVLSYLVSYLEKVGIGGITVFFYESGNQRSFEEVKRLVETQANQHVMIFPRNRDGSQGGPGVMRIDTSGSAVGMFHSLVSEYFDAKILNLILGQTLTYSSDGATRAAAQVHENTFFRLIQFDALSLASALTRDLVRVIYRHSFPEVPEHLYPRFTFIIPPPNSDTMLNYAQILTSMGIAVDENQLRDITGLVAPKRTENIANVNLAPYIPSESTIPFINEILAKNRPDSDDTLDISEKEHEDKQREETNDSLVGRE